METTTLGRTGLTVSVAGLGCGGNSRIGIGRDLPRADCVRIVREALDQGINFIDTAEAYGTEDIVGEAIEEAGRDRAVISTKAFYVEGGTLRTGAEVVERLHASLASLRTDHVDVFHVHAVKPDDYPYVREEIVPALLKARDAGLFKHLGITETPPRDNEQTMLPVAIADDVWEVIMVAYHMMNQRPGQTIFPVTHEKGIGTLIMFAVRNIFSRPEQLRATLRELADNGTIPAELAEQAEPLEFLLGEGGAESLTDAAYRFARHAEGVDVVLFGTGSIDHLKANVRSINAPPLPQETTRTLHTLFGSLSGIGLDRPDRLKPNY